MLDLRWIRDNPETLDQKMAARKRAPIAQEILALDEKHRNTQTQLQQLLAQRNEIARLVGVAKQQKDETLAKDYLSQANAVKELIPAMEKEEGAISAQLHAILQELPNLPAQDVPLGQDEDQNVLIREWGTPTSMDFNPKPHYELGESLEMMDFEQAAHMAGARFVILKKDLAKMERALASFMLDIHTQEFGYEEVVPPLLMRSNSVYGVGQLPKFEQDLFKTTDGRYLISTGEVPLTNMVADKILPVGKMPLRYVAYTPCFRSEAGSAGRDTRGMIRQHQFTKVELVSIVTPEDSTQEHERMTTAAETILQRLNLPYRVMLLCTGDMGASAEKTYDIEVWLPSENAYREISSCSNCGQYQARRLNARYKTDNGKPEFAATLNGSGLPIGRTMVAILENYQQADGTIQIPSELVPYMGTTTIPRTT